MNINPKLLGGSVLLLALFLLPSSDAMPKTSREFCGSVARFELSNGTLVVRNGNRRLELSVTPRTRVVQGRTFVDIRSLESEASICVRYRAPIFGRASATRIFWREADPRKR